jgi:hypothetical protein
MISHDNARKPEMADHSKAVRNGISQGRLAMGAVAWSADSAVCFLKVISTMSAAAAFKHAAMRVVPLMPKLPSSQCAAMKAPSAAPSVFTK